MDSLLTTVKYTKTKWIKKQVNTNFYVTLGRGKWNYLTAKKEQSNDEKMLVKMLFMLLK